MQKVLEGGKLSARYLASMGKIQGTLCISGPINPRKCKSGDHALDPALRLAVSANCVLDFLLLLISVRFFTPNLHSQEGTAVKDPGTDHGQARKYLHYSSTVKQRPDRRSRCRGKLHSVVGQRHGHFASMASASIRLVTCGPWTPIHRRSISSRRKGKSFSRSTLEVCPLLPVLFAVHPTALGCPRPCLAD